ncbi:uridine kinase [Cellulomonas dongxiuzhuiae]|uniref:Uridine kinase n=1 Tax=Cellulomonas dongxiuzhuiae TaxID=2819979 RepID=A0ABX8GH54_9CELL|nr:uridine kinase [Cellulomonas dongxiuzhuiae]QWC15163.1 uridine kinase [Cellulomonas dongxiuzhuiae]
MSRAWYSNRSTWSGFLSSRCVQRPGAAASPGRSYRRDPGPSTSRDCVCAHLVATAVPAGPVDRYRRGVTEARTVVLRAVAAVLPDPRVLGRPVRVAVDGVDGAGKTTFADELAEVLRADGRSVLRASVDGFHRPAAQRYRRGRASPEGFFLDSYDLDALRRVLLDPLRADRGRPRRVRTAVHDVVTDADPGTPWVDVDDATIAVVDGIFLHRDELVDVWDLSIWLEVPFEVTYRRMAVRDGCPPDPDHDANTRYREGQRLYLAACGPAERAHVVVDNSDTTRPRVLRSP